MSSKSLDVIRYFSVLTFTKAVFSAAIIKGYINFLSRSKVPPLLNRVTNLPSLRVMVCLDKHVHEHRTPVMGYPDLGLGKMVCDALQKVTTAT